ncbi:hypothetical protein D3C87_161690 [compost metagenome]
MKSLKVTKSFQVLFCFAIFLVAFVTRFYGLELKPIHFDESINGWFVMQMKLNGFYKYDPNNYHGPLYFYLLQLLEFFWGTSLRVLRTLPTIFSIATVMLFLWGWARTTAWNLWVLFFILVSPAFLFFGRSGIHEMPFVFFQICFALGVMRWLGTQKDARALALILVGLFGVVTLKETFAILLVASAVGFLSLGFSELKKIFDSQSVREAWNRRLTIWSILLLLLFFGLFSGFGRNPQGIADFVNAFLPWMKTGAHGHGHEKEFLYWVKTMAEAEPLALAGVVLAFWGVLTSDRSLRWISVVGLVQLLIYSLIPYKTVWCILSLVWPFYFVLASYVERAWRGPRSVKITALFIVILGTVLQGQSAWRAVYKEPLDLAHPYVYVNSTHESQKISAIFLKALVDHPEISQQVWQVGADEQWPWPWVLRHVQSLNFTLCHDRIVADAIVYICKEDRQTQVESQLKESYYKFVLPLRQHQADSVIYLKSAIFAPYMSATEEQVGPGKEVAP